MYELPFVGIAIVCIIIHLARTKKRTPAKVVEICLLYLLTIVIGGVSVFSGLFHVFDGPNIAKQIGWAPSPFQAEVGWANVGIGVAALLGFFIRGTYWFAPIITEAIFLYGAAYGHFVQIAKGDTAAYNSGFFLYFGDLFLPTLALVLAFFYYTMVVSKKKTK